MSGFRNHGLENQVIYDDEDGDKIVRSMFYKFAKLFFLNV